ncbi:MAG: hypothetical protein AMXMBFR36_17350 [Acidobacteriota bacterium]
MTATAGFPGSRLALPASIAAGALAAGLGLALVGSPIAPADPARVSADAMAFTGHAWLLENGQVAHRDFSAAWGPVPQVLARLAVPLGPGGFLDAVPAIFFVLRAAGVATLVAWALLLPLGSPGRAAVPLVVFAWTLQPWSHAVFRLGVALLALRAAAWALAAPRTAGRRAALAAALLIVAASCSFEVFVYAAAAIAIGGAALAANSPRGARAPILRRLAAITIAASTAAFAALVAAAATAADPAQSWLATAQRIVARSATYAQVFGRPLELDPFALVAWLGLIAAAAVGWWRALRRRDDALRPDLALLGPFALLNLKSAVTRGDLGHVAFGLTGVLALLAVLAASANRGRTERAALTGALVAAALLWPTPTLAGGLRTALTLDPLRAWRELRTNVTAAELLPRETLALARRNPGPLFVFPLQSGFAAEVGRPLAAAVDQVYGAHTPELQDAVVESLRDAGPGLEVIYGLDGLPTWRVDQVQSIARSPVVARYLWSEFEAVPARMLDGGYLLLRRRERPQALRWRPLAFRTVGAGTPASVEIVLEPAVSCPLLRIALEISHPASARLTWAGGLRVRGEYAGRPVLRGRLVSLAVGRTFETYLSPLEGEDFASLFGDGPIAEAPPLARLRIEPEATGPFGVAPDRIEVRELACRVGDGSPG